MGVHENWVDVNGTIRNCPRCGQDHKIEIQTLTSTIVDPTPPDPSNPCVYNKFAMCPINKQPILFREENLNNVILVPIKPANSRVKELAKKLWQLDGRKEGRDKHHWKVAEYALTTHVRIPITKKLREMCGDTVDDLLGASNQLIDKEMEKDLEVYIKKHLKEENKE